MVKRFANDHEVTGFNLGQSLQNILAKHDLVVRTARLSIDKWLN